VGLRNWNRSEDFERLTTMRDWFSEQSIEAEVVIIPEAEGTSPPPRGAEVDAMYRIRFVSGRAVCFLEGEGPVCFCVSKALLTKFEKFLFFY
jgi:hypothetical protein